MAFVLKIAVASAVLAAAFVYGSEHDASGARPAPARAALGALATEAPGGAPDPRCCVRIISAHREPVRS